MTSMTSDIIPFYAHTWRSLSVEPATHIWAVLAICLGHIWILLVWYVPDVASIYEVRLDMGLILMTSGNSIYRHKGDSVWFH